ncbi:MAG TPA: hypothetical protein VFO73_06200 [Candidatus Limnocylindrales bacterium]|jgi:hypothetical protein|nr:hypothetical protein [Candidatus Limnocylindrales bacterium]
MNANNSAGPRRTSILAASLGAVAGVAIIAAVAFGGSPKPAPNPTTTPVVTPVPTAEPSVKPPAVTPVPAPVATPVPTPAPTDGGNDAMPLTVNLENATDDDVRVDIVDGTGILAGAESGTPGDGASVESYTLKVENVDAKTLRLTWVDYPIDNALALYIDPDGDGYRFVLVQPEPTGDTDAMAFDRELVLTFAEPISASQVEALLQDGLDTPG